MTSIDRQLLSSEMARLEPSEIIIADTPGPLGAMAAELAKTGAALTPLPPSHFDSAAGEVRLKQHFAVHALEAFGAFSRPELAAAGALLDYVSAGRPAAAARGTAPALAGQPYANRPGKPDQSGDHALIGGDGRAA